MTEVIQRLVTCLLLLLFEINHRTRSCKVNSSKDTVHQFVWIHACPSWIMLVNVSLVVQHVNTVDHQVFDGLDGDWWYGG